MAGFRDLNGGHVDLKPVRVQRHAEPLRYLRLGFGVELALGIGCDDNFAVLEGREPPPDNPGDQGGFADAMAGRNGTLKGLMASIRISQVLPDRGENFRLPSAWTSRVRQVTFTPREAIKDSFQGIVAVRAKIGSHNVALGLRGGAHA